MLHLYSGNPRTEGPGNQKSSQGMKLADAAEVEVSLVALLKTVVDLSYSLALLENHAYCPAAHQ